MVHSISGQTHEGTVRVLQDLPEISKCCVPGRFTLFSSLFFQRNLSITAYDVVHTFAEFSPARKRI